MALFLGVHVVTGDVTPDDVSRLHAATGADAGSFGARCLRSWTDRESGKVFCLVEADDVDLARSVHFGTAGLALEECHPVSEYA